jgi:hypothetical protein
VAIIDDILNYEILSESDEGTYKKINKKLI